MSCKHNKSFAHTVYIITHRIHTTALETSRAREIHKSIIYRTGPMRKKGISSLLRVEVV